MGKEAEICNKLNSIEEILKMLLVNSVFCDSEIERMKKNILDAIKKILEPYGFSDIRLNYIENEYYVFAELYDKTSAKNILKIYNLVSEKLDGVKLVLVFDKLHFNTKKALEKYNVSLYERNGEMRIFLGS